LGERGAQDSSAEADAHTISMDTTEPKKRTEKLLKVAIKCVTLKTI